jgi:thiol-disulfide isomerase/thioredoxin
MPLNPRTTFFAITLFVAGVCGTISSGYAGTATAAETEVQPALQSLPLPSGEEMTFEVFSPQRPQGDLVQGTAPNLRVLWIAPSFGINSRHRQAAERLAERGAEVWLIDLADSLFLTRSAQTLRDIPGSLVADIIDALSTSVEPPIPLVVVSNSYGAIPTLRGIHSWQQRRQTLDQARPAGLIGSILFSPSFLTRVPPLGQPAEFIAELPATNSPLYIFQAANNSSRGQLPAAQQQLQHATLYVEILKDVMSAFYDKDTSAISQQRFNQVPDMILRASQQLAQHAMPQTALPLAASAKATIRSGLDTQLKAYSGQIKPEPIALNDANGKPFTVADYRGRVTIINFWASWCRPCVKEIPSLNRLKQAMQGKPFRLISINFAESAMDINNFLKLVDVDFPVLLDLDGRVAGQWNVFAFPSTFVIGPDGQIHFGVNAGIHWDTPEVMQQIQQLLPTP